MSPNRRIFLNIIATYGRSLYALVCGLFISRWVLVALGKTDFGLYGVVGGMTVFIAYLNNLLSTATSRFYAYSVGQAQKMSDNSAWGLEESRKWFSTALMLHIVVPIVLIVVGYPLGLYSVEHWLTIPVERLCACRWVFRYACFSCFVGMINVPFHAMYTAKQYIAELTVYSVFTTTANIFFMHYMVTHPGDWLSKYAFWMCLISVVPQVIICFRAIKVFPECRFRISYAIDRERVFEFLSFSFWQTFGGLGGILRGQGIQILINKYFDPTYNAAMSIANQVSGHSQALSSAMMGAFAPAVTTAYGAGKDEVMRELSYRTSKFGASLALLFMLPLALELRTVLNLWLIDPPPCVAGLCWCILLMAVIDKSTAGQMLAVSASGRIAAYLAFSGGSLILSLPIAWFFVEIGLPFTFIGVAMVMTMLLCAIGRIWFAGKIVGMSVGKWFLGGVLPILFTVILAGFVGLLSQCIMPPSLVRVCITSVVTVIVFAVMSYMLILSSDERKYLLTKLRLNCNGKR